MVADGAFSHKIDYLTIFEEILNPEGHPNLITGLKVTAILLNVLQTSSSCPAWAFGN